MFTPALLHTLDALLKRTPLEWLLEVCQVLRDMHPSAKVEFIIQQVPLTVNGDNVALLREILQQCGAQMTWDAISWMLEASFHTHTRQANAHKVELLWSGPAPELHIPARRIDQVLYDLLAEARHEVLILTFAAHKVPRLNLALCAALRRGVRLRMVLEFEDSSQGQLSIDALRAFPAQVRHQAEIYYWPTEQRETNPAGRPGKLHAKVAVVDDKALISSANLTDDAFNRNWELGVLLAGDEVASKVVTYVAGLVEAQVLLRCDT